MEDPTTTRARASSGERSAPSGGARSPVSTSSAQHPKAALRGALAALSALGVSPTGRAVYGALWSFTDARGRCWPSQETLARATGRCVRTVRAAVQELERRRAIMRDVPDLRERRRRRRTTCYLLVPLTVPQASTRPPPAPAVSPRRVLEVDPDAPALVWGDDVEVPAAELLPGLDVDPPQATPEHLAVAPEEHLLPAEHGPAPEADDGPAADGAPSAPSPVDDPPPEPPVAPLAPLPGDPMADDAPTQPDPLAAPSGAPLEPAVTRDAPPVTPPSRLVTLAPSGAPTAPPVAAPITGNSRRPISGNGYRQKTQGMNTSPRPSAPPPGTMPLPLRDVLARCMAAAPPSALPRRR